MNGIELAERLYLTCGRDLIEKAVPEAVGRIAVGIAGPGSECFGYDDELSRDHDFEPGFSIWLTDEDDIRFGVQLARAYRSLPREFEGVKLLSKTGEGARFGVSTADGFFRSTLGRIDVPSDPMEWMALPDHAIAVAVNGKIFSDEAGIMTKRREAFRYGMPGDVRKQKLAARLALMAQAGEYNYPRMLARGDEPAARLAVYEYVRHALAAVYLVAGEPRPYYKWQFRGLLDLPCLTETREPLARLVAGGDREITLSAIAEVNAAIAHELSAQGTSLDRLAQEMHAAISDRRIRELHLMEYGAD
ncbi:MAG: DUF4037 domain-containing protein [Clostridia bacterium]|nr:DUF4037 domain-containing protein [Clostridia bacterium]